MATEWYYQGENGSFGPIDSADLKSFAAIGEITPTTLVRKGNDGEWVTAKNVKGLFTQTPPVVEKPSPQEIATPVAVPSGLPTISPNELPEVARIKLQPAESVYHFAYIDSQGGGCSNPSKATQWLLVTDRRILFEGSIKQAVNISQFVHQSGSIPIAKVSYVGVSELERPQGCGCANVTVTLLAINSSGGEIFLAMPTTRQAKSAQWVIDAVISRTT